MRDVSTGRARPHPKVAEPGGLTRRWLEAKRRASQPTSQHRGHVPGGLLRIADGLKPTARLRLRTPGADEGIFIRTRLQSTCSCTGGGAVPWRWPCAGAVLSYTVYKVVRKLRFTVGKEDSYPLPYQTLSGVFATNSGIASHAALPHPLPPSKHVHHVWVWNGLWDHSVRPILPRDTSPKASQSRLWGVW